MYFIMPMCCDCPFIMQWLLSFCKDSNPSASTVSLHSLCLRSHIDQFFLMHVSYNVLARCLTYSWCLLRKAYCICFFCENLLYMLTLVVRCSIDMSFFTCRHHLHMLLLQACTMELGTLLIFYNKNLNILILLLFVFLFYILINVHVSTADENLETEKRTMYLFCMWLDCNRFISNRWLFGHKGGRFYTKIT